MLFLDWLASLKSDFGYIALLFVLFVLPKFLQRFGLPSALTALVFGGAAGIGFGMSHEDQTVRVLATLGIVALFLFAGLDVDLAELHRERRVLAEDGIVRAIALVPVAIAAQHFFDLSARAAVLVALCLMTPSTGFILDSLRGWGLADREQFWIRSKAIATELVALAVLFVALQSTSVLRLSLSAAALVAMIAVLPAVFRWFAVVVVPHAPKSEFGFLVMTAVACASITRGLGVYYLVGAFVVGMSARQFRESLPSLSSDRLIHSVEAMASLFVPFYFFRAGLELDAGLFTRWAFVVGAAFVLIVLPFRFLLVATHRVARFGERFRQTLRVGVPLLPTTVFTLVIVDLLRERFTVPPFLLGALVLYMLVNTLVPSLLLRRPAEPFEDELLRGDEAR